MPPRKGSQTQLFGSDPRSLRTFPGKGGLSAPARLRPRRMARPQASGSPGWAVRRRRASKHRPRVSGDLEPESGGRETLCQWCLPATGGNSSERVNFLGPLVTFAILTLDTHRGAPPQRMQRARPPVSVAQCHTRTIKQIPKSTTRSPWPRDGEG